jgi:N-acetyl-gamma-glutamyl-phosphate/LysW-gamma-L-alpha-aminoadipyl-6-phosphate reductase
MFGVAIIGGSGYGAGELLRFLSYHDSIEVAAVVSRSYAGRSVTSVHTHLTRVIPEDLKFVAALPDNWHKHYKSSVIVSSVPTGESLKAIGEILSREDSRESSIIDLSGDLRLRDEQQHLKHYSETPFAAELRSSAVYGLPEVVGEATVRSAKIVSNPGCLATATILALAPLRDKAAGLEFVAVDAKTGTSGAGREPQASMHHPSRAHDCTAYKILQHRHEGEILQILGSDFSNGRGLHFVPHLLPISRGVLVTCFLSFRDATSAHEAAARLANYYTGAYFIRMRDYPVRIVDVVGTNFCDINVVVRDQRMVVTCALDNLGKGMAGQCVQNINLMLGLEHSYGLRGLAALGPV